MNDQWTDRLSQYLDGELPAAERAALDTHLATCAACRATLAELRAVVARAQTLEDQPPATDLWPGIRAGITPVAPARGAGARHPWRVSLGVPQLLAASVALVLLTGAAMWLALRPSAEQPLPVAIAPEGPLGGGTAVGWTVRTDMAVAQLEGALARNESRLDTATVRVVRHNLAVIDRAIEQAQRALAADPGSAYLNLHLARTMRRKIELLRRANALAASES